MIKVFETTYDNELLKVNYVDDNNLFAGFDMECDCCEYPSHRIEDSDGNIIEPNYKNLFYDLIFTGELPEEDEWCDTCTARIPLKHKTTNERYYLVFSNCHNGWYAHGYEFGEIKIKHSSSV